MGKPSSDRPLDARLVTGLIDAQLPVLRGQPVSWLGAGWDNELFGVGREWILRFPRRAERVAWLTREITIMSALAGTLAPRVPVFELIGQPSDAFPYPFVGYRRLPGVAADQIPAADRPGLAADIGGLLSALHRIDPGVVPPTPTGWERESWDDLRAELAEAADRTRPLLGPVMLARAEPYLAGQVPPPPRDGPRRFIHNDICAEHLLADPGTGRLTGLIDFTDAMAGDPVQDFVGLITVGGYGFISQVVASYAVPLGDGFPARLQWLCRVRTLTWLAEAAADDLASVPARLSLVARAFTSYPPSLWPGQPTVPGRRALTPSAA
jgi:aminoglycoside phosphotransferase (APT) family kinase protein